MEEFICTYHVFPEKKEKDENASHLSKNRWLVFFCRCLVFFDRCFVFENIFEIFYDFSEKFALHL